MITPDIIRIKILIVWEVNHKLLLLSTIHYTDDQNCDASGMEDSSIHVM